MLLEIFTYLLTYLLICLLSTRLGVNEDPVTGSAHCSLSSFWYSKLYPSTPTQKLNAYQASARGGYISMQRMESDPNRLILSGNCFLVMKTDHFGLKEATHDELKS